MFESSGEIVVLALSAVVVWMVAWAVAERRTVRMISAGYETEANRARRRIAELEDQLVARRLPARGDGERGERAVESFHVASR